MALAPFQTYSFQSLGIPETTLGCASFRVSAVQVTLATQSTIYLVSLDPLTLITQIPNKIDGAFPSSVKNHMLLCKGDKAQLLDTVEKKTIAVLARKVFFAFSQGQSWLVLTDSGVIKADYEFKQLQELAAVKLQPTTVFWAQWDGAVDFVIAYEENGRKCLVCDKIVEQESALLAHQRVYNTADLNGAKICCYLPHFDMVVCAAAGELQILHYGATVARIPFAEKAVYLFANAQGFSVLTDQMVVKSFKIPLTLVEELPVQNLYQSCQITNYYNHRINTGIISKYADYCVKNELYQKAAEAVIGNEQARDFVLSQTRLSQNFANYAQQLMKLDRLTKQETLALANRLQQAGKAAGLLKFESKITFSQDLADYLIQENQLIDRELSKLLIKIYDQIGDYEKVARFLVKNESIKNGIAYCKMKEFKFDLLSLVVERQLETDKDDVLGILNEGLYGEKLADACELAASKGAQKEILQFLGQFKENKLANTLKLKYMMHFAPAQKKQEIELRLATFLMSTDVDPDLLVKWCQQYECYNLKLAVVLKYQIRCSELENADFAQFLQILQAGFAVDSFSAEFIDFLQHTVQSRQLAEILLKADGNAKFSDNTYFEEVLLYRQVFTDNVAEKRQRYFEVLVQNYIVANHFDVAPFAFFFNELKIEILEIRKFDVTLNEQQQKNFVAAVIQQIKQEADLQYLLDLGFVSSDLLYAQIFANFNVGDNLKIASLLYARIGEIDILEAHFLKLPPGLQDQVVTLLCKLQYEVVPDKVQHLLQFIIVKTAVKAQAETMKMLSNALFGEENKFDAMLVNQRLACDIFAQVKLCSDDRVVQVLQMIKTFDQTLIRPFIELLLKNEYSEPVRVAIIEVVLSLQSEELLVEMMQAFDQDFFVPYIVSKQAAAFVCGAAVKTAGMNYQALYEKCESYLMDDNQDLLLKLALKSKNEELALATLQKVSCVLTSQHAELSAGMPVVQYQIYFKSGQFLQALQLIDAHELDYDSFDVASRSQDVICCNYVIQQRCQQDFEKCLDLLVQAHDLTCCNNLIKAAQEQEMAQRERLATALMETREISENRSYDSQICKYLGILYQESSEMAKTLLLQLVPQLTSAQAQQIGDQLFIIEYFKAARPFYQQACNFKALNDCCLKVGDFAGALKSACQMNSQELFKGMLSFVETRIFGLANLLKDAEMMQAFCQSKDEEFLKDLEVAMEMCAFADISGNIANLDQNLNQISANQVLSVRDEAVTNFAMNKHFVLNTFCPQLYDVLAMLLLKQHNERIMLILKQFHGKMDLRKVRQIAEKMENHDAVTFCDVAVGDLESAINTLILHKNNIQQLIKLLSFCEVTALHQRAAEMMLESAPDDYFGQYLSQSWRKETLEHACAICGKQAAKLCAFIHTQQIYSMQCAAEFCFANEPENEELSRFVRECNPAPLLQLTKRRDLRVLLLARAQEFQASAAEATDAEFDVLVDAAVYERSHQFAFQVVAKVKDSDKFDSYLGLLKGMLKLSQLVRVAAICGFRESVAEAVAEAVESVEKQLEAKH